jgi:transcriptional regulator with XRE-family HTH domain
LFSKSPVSLVGSRVETGLFLCPLTREGESRTFKKVRQDLVIVFIMCIFTVFCQEVYYTFNMARKLLSDLPSLNLGNETIGERIAALRRKKGLTQNQLAKLMGIDRTLITDYERNKIRIYSEMLARFALALSVSTDELIGIKDLKRDTYNPSLKITRRLKKIEKLSSDKQRLVLQNIDLVLKAVEK